MEKGPGAELPAPSGTDEVGYWSGLLQGGAGLPVGPGLGPVAVQVPHRELGAAGVRHLDDVAEAHVLEEPLGVRRVQVDAAVRDVRTSLLPHAVRVLVDELAVVGDPLRELLVRAVRLRVRRADAVRA